MSRLSERIRIASRRESGRIGFGVVAERRPSSTLLVVVRLDKSQAKNVKNAAGNADVIIISGEPNELKDVVAGAEGVPVGLSLERADRAAVAAARDAGADFVLLGEASLAETLLEEGIGLGLRLSDQEGDTELRAMAGLPLDALEISPPEDPLSVRRLVELRRTALLAATPMLTEVAPGADASRLQTLRDAGVAGVILDGAAIDKLSALRDRILSLPVRGRRREERAEAMLPSVAGVPEEEDEEPDIE